MIGIATGFSEYLTHYFEGVHLCFLKEKAVLLPEFNVLLIADVHLGKALHFRKNGVPVPDLPEQETLNRLSNLHIQYPKTTIWVLGDLFHKGAEASSGNFENWLSLHPRIKINLLAGNHDKGSEVFCLNNGIGFLKEKAKIGPFQLFHEPPIENEKPYFAGHIHPVYKINGSLGGISMPCFWQRKNGWVLPAFGGFTGGWQVSGQETEGVVLVSASGVRLLNLSAGS